MIKPTSRDALASNSVSPIRGNIKHQIAPLKTRRKTSRKDQSADVHTCSSSTPNRLQSGNQYGTFNSPSDSFLCSQDNRPDVVWDYTSPKLPKGSKKREIQMTVDEFLKNLPHTQAPECNTQNSGYIKLLNKWMAKQTTPVCVQKPAKTARRDYKMRTRRICKEIQQFMESIQKNNEDKVEENESSREETTDENTLPKIESPNHSSILLNKKSFLEGDENENDSIEELWGEADNSFIVKATQQLDASCSRYNAQSKNADIASTIPETVTNTSNEPQNINHGAEQTVGSNSFNKIVFDSDYQAHILLTQILHCEWNSESDSEDMENGFIMGDEDLSRIPDEVLSGTENELNKRIEPSVVDKHCDNETLSNKLQHENDSGRQHIVNKSPEITFGCSDSDRNKQDNQISNDVLQYDSDARRQHANRSPEITFGCSESNRVTVQSDNELFNNFEDDSFGDESILCKPEVLSWIDEVENNLSQSQKCTPEEIEKKKDEAVQRRKKKNNHKR